MRVELRAPAAHLAFVLLLASGCQSPSAVRITLTATRSDAPSALSIAFAPGDAPFGTPVSVPEHGPPPPLPGVVLVRIPDQAILLRAFAQATFTDGAVLEAAGAVVTVPQAEVSLPLALEGEVIADDLSLVADAAMPVYDFAGAAPLDLAGPPRCTDRTKNQDETDIDCGGTICPRCDDGLACLGNNDCQSKTCQNNRCVNLPCGPFTCGKNEYCSFSQSCSCGSKMATLGKACGGGTLCCAGACLDTSTDKNNCGDCGIVCDSGLVCSAGKCVCTATSCTTGCCEVTPFGPRCLGISTAHCAPVGGSCVACSLLSNDSCSAATGQCVCAAAAMSCPAGKQCLPSGCN